MARSLDALGDAWSLLILRDVFIGIRRFSDLESRLGITSSTLTRRLEQLCARGLLEAHTYAEHPPRYEYLLTPQGEDFLPVLLALGAWGNRWFTEAIVPIDPETGQRFEPVLVDKQSGRVLNAGTVALAAGPGAPTGVREFLKLPRLLGAKAPRIAIEVRA